MNAKIASAKHAASTTNPTPDHRNLKSRAGAALVSGCLALSMCPALAFAAPAAPDAQQNASQPAMEQTFDQQSIQDQMGPMNQAGPMGQVDQGMQAGAPDQGMQQNGAEAPAGLDQQAAPDQAQLPDENANQVPGTPSDQQGQAPSDQPGQPAADDELGSQVRDILSSDYGVESPDFENAPDQAAGQMPNQAASQMPNQAAGQMPDQPQEAPELPDGEPNVQQLIDAAHDVLAKYTSSDLESANFADEDFASELASYVKAATTERLAMFANGGQPDQATPPSDAQAPTEESGESNETAAPEAPEASEAPAAPEQASVSSSVLSQIVDFLMDVFGYSK